MSTSIKKLQYDINAYDILVLIMLKITYNSNTSKLFNYFAVLNRKYREMIKKTIKEFGVSMSVKEKDKQKNNITVKVLEVLSPCVDK